MAAVVTRTKWTKFLAIISLGLIVACDSGGLSTLDVQTAAKERVRRSLGLTGETALFTDVFVGSPRDGEVVLCGTVKGEKPDGSTVGPRRFVAGTDPAQWLHFETAAEVGEVDTIDPTAMNMFVDEWAKFCAGERGR